jgi:hypothetical protein
MTCFTIEIPRWHPARLNQMKGHWAKGHHLKKVDRVMVAAYASGVPKAQGKRRVSLHIILNKGQRAADPDGQFKSLCDALVHAKMLVNDNRQYVELAPVTFSRRPKGWGTVISLEDL